MAFLSLSRIATLPLSRRTNTKTASLSCCCCVVAAAAAKGSSDNSELRPVTLDGYITGARSFLPFAREEVLLVLLRTTSLANSQPERERERWVCCPRESRSRGPRQRSTSNWSRKLESSSSWPTTTVSRRDLGTSSSGETRCAPFNNRDDPFPVPFDDAYTNYYVHCVVLLDRVHSDCH